jgi:hypothetical protein
MLSIIGGEHFVCMNLEFPCHIKLDATKIVFAFPKVFVGFSTNQ